MPTEVLRHGGAPTWLVRRHGKKRLFLFATLLSAIAPCAGCDFDTEERAQYKRIGDAGPALPEIADGPAEPYDLRRADRQRCVAFGPGSLTTETIGPDVPHGAALPFKHVVLLLQENRSFDHYLSQLPAYGLPGIDVATDDDWNPRSPSAVDGGSLAVHRFHAPHLCEPCGDLDHEWEAAHLEYDQGRMDGFVTANDPHGARSMSYYGPNDIPYYYWLAKTFGIGDRHFSSVIGPTWPNRYYALAATSAGCTYTPDLGHLQIACEDKPAQNILTLLDGHASHEVYSGLGPVCVDSICGQLSLFESMFLSAGEIIDRIQHSGSTLGLEEFFAAVDANDLPQVSLLEPHFYQDDEHPPQDIRHGQALVQRVVAAIGSQPELWQSTVLFVTYDENGGYYDHVPPPHACAPDSVLPATYGFDRLGFRVPLFVVSAYNKPGWVSHLITDHTSILRFIENLFDLPAMTARDANAWPLLDRFDFDHMSFPSFPADAPPAPDPGSSACVSCSDAPNDSSCVRCEL